jgi:hypothetical protein
VIHRADDELRALGCLLLPLVVGACFAGMGVMMIAGHQNGVGVEVAPDHETDASVNGDE